MARKAKQLRDVCHVTLGGGTKIRLVKVVGPDFAINLFYDTESGKLTNLGLSEDWNETVLGAVRSLLDDETSSAIIAT